MLFRTTFKKEFASTAGATFVALFSIILTTVLVRTLGQAAGGQVDGAQVMTLIMLGCVQYLAPALVITVFVAVMASVSRAYRDHEMTAWQVSGLSLMALVRPVLRFTLPLFLLALVCSVWVTPWAKAELSASKARFALRSDVSKVSAGQFRESSDGRRVFFVEQHNESTQEVTNVFVVDERGDQRVVMAASSGSVEVSEGGQRYLVLKDGRRFGIQEAGDRFSSTDFTEYGLAIQTNLASTPSLQLKHQSIETVMAQDSPDARGELLWRFSLPLSALVLGLLAVPLAFVNPRGGRSLNQIFALLIYLTYSNIISVTQTLVVKESLPFGVALVLPHLAVLLLFAWLVHRRGLPSGSPFLFRRFRVARSSRLARSKGRG